MPLRVNYSGVIPIIFASAILMFPQKLLQMLPKDWEWAQALAVHFGMDQVLYTFCYGLLILFFSYFWVATVFNPVQIADDLKKAGGYVPGIRPGTPTAEFLDRTMTRITLAGSIFLTIIAVIPTIMARQFNIPWIVASFFGGTSLLIVVGVMLDTMRQVESHLIMRHYDGFLKKGHLRGRR
jgi:preprotein translocase subunit SecY